MTIMNNFQKTKQSTKGNLIELAANTTKSIQNERLATKTPSRSGCPNQSDLTAVILHSNYKDVSVSQYTSLIPKTRLYQIVLCPENPFALYDRTTYSFANFSKAN
jgi:hypothetical protein